MSTKISELIELKRRKLQKTEKRIQILHNNVYVLDKKLKKEKEDHTHDSLARTRAQTHNMAVDNDRLNRPSDQQMPTRTYGKMDTDLWTRSEVRLWFNKKASDEPDFHFSPSKTGYTVLADPHK